MNTVLPHTPLNQYLKMIAHRFMAISLSISIATLSCLGTVQGMEMPTEQKSPDTMRSYVQETINSTEALRVRTILHFSSMVRSRNLKDIKNLLSENISYFIKIWACSFETHYRPIYPNIDLQGEVQECEGLAESIVASFSQETSNVEDYAFAIFSVFEGARKKYVNLKHSLKIAHFFDINSLENECYSGDELDYEENLQFMNEALEKIKKYDEERNKCYDRIARNVKESDETYFCNFVSTSPAQERILQLIKVSLNNLVPEEIKEVRELNKNFIKYFQCKKLLEPANSRKYTLQTGLDLGESSGVISSINNRDTYKKILMFFNKKVEEFSGINKVTEEADRNPSSVQINLMTPGMLPQGFMPPACTITPEKTLRKKKVPAGRKIEEVIPRKILSAAELKAYNAKVDEDLASLFAEEEKLKKGGGQPKNGGGKKGQQSQSPGGKKGVKNTSSNGQTPKPKRDTTTITTTTTTTTTTQSKASKVEETAKRTEELRLKQEEERRKKAEAAEVKRKEEERKKAEQLSLKQEEERRKKVEAAEVKRKEEERKKSEALAEAAKYAEQSRLKQEEERKRAEAAEVKRKEEERKRSEEAAQSLKNALGVGVSQEVGHQSLTPTVFGPSLLSPHQGQYPQSPQHKTSSPSTSMSTQSASAMGGTSQTPATKPSTHPKWAERVFEAPRPQQALPSQLRQAEERKKAEVSRKEEEWKKAEAAKHAKQSRLRQEKEQRKKRDQYPQRPQPKTSSLSTSVSTQSRSAMGGTPQTQATRSSTQPKWSDLVVEAPRPQQALPSQLRQAEERKKAEAVKHAEQSKRRQEEGRKRAEAAMGSTSQTQATKPSTQPKWADVVGGTPNPQQASSSNSLRNTQDTSSAVKALTTIPPQATASWADDDEDSVYLKDIGYVNRTDLTKYIRIDGTYYPREMISNLGNEVSYCEYDEDLGWYDPKFAEKEYG